MTIQQFDFVNVQDKANALGCNIPTRMAVLPRNFETAESKSALLHESNTPTIRVLFRTNGILETPLECEGEKFPQISEKAFDAWIAPTIFVSCALISQNPHIVSVALGVISNYLTDWLKGIPGKRNANLDIVVETKTGSCKRIHYEGPASGLEELTQVVHEVFSSE